MSLQNENLFVKLVKKSVGLPTTKSDCCGAPASAQASDCCGTGSTGDCCGAGDGQASSCSSDSVSGTGSACCGTDNASGGCCN